MENLTYYELNKEIRLKKAKEYYHKNKIQINEKNKQYYRDVYYPKNKYKLCLKQQLGRILYKDKPCELKIEKGNFKINF